MATARSFGSARRGYTLVEMMVVVIIAGVLVTLAVIGVRKYIFTAKTAEAIHMIGAISSAEESYREETGSYLTASSNINNYYPQTDLTPNKTKWAWANPAHTDYAKWRLLAVSANEPVQFGYVAVAGLQTDAIPAPGTAANFSSVAPTGPWVLIKAAGDQNDNGIYSYFVTVRGDGVSSAIHIENESE
ncbi:MAG: type II secretion system protein [Myxococcales bacterium]|nr:type II secretion system protein [Myxococcales bacterium]MCB9577283.1 type II secretion system protein [Polyangiaceae bacterium]